MSEPVMSMYASKEGCLQARADYFKSQRDKLLESLKRLEALTFCEDNVLRSSGLGEVGVEARKLIAEVEASK